MAAPKGNKFAIGNGGKRKEFDSPGELEIFIQEYHDDRKRNPIRMWHTQLDKNTGQPVSIEVERPATVEGLAVWLGVTRQTLLNYQKREGYEEFFDVIVRAKQQIMAIKAEGALAGTYKENFTKFLMMNNSDYVERTELKSINENHNFNSEPMTPQEIKEIGEALEGDF